MIGWTEVRVGCCPGIPVFPQGGLWFLSCSGLLRPLAEESLDFLRVGGTRSIVLIPVRVCVEGGAGRWAESGGGGWEQGLVHGTGRRGQARAALAVGRVFPWDLLQ